jgi:hypothetical protein
MLVRLIGVLVAVFGVLLFFSLYPDPPPIPAAAASGICVTAGIIVALLGEEVLY